MNNETRGDRCPIPNDSTHQSVVLAHGEGGRMMRRLIEQRILPRLNRSISDGANDGARRTLASNDFVMTTDSYVVSPLFFPGGDIGRLAVFGTVNDLAASGACPMYLSLSLILEEGLEFSTLDRILESIATAAEIADIEIITGDTKVVPRGAVDKIFITTTGIGCPLSWNSIDASQIEVGDHLIVTGPLGRHGMAVMTARDSLPFHPSPESDCASLWPAVQQLHTAGITPRSLRDATRGGLAAVLHEWSATCGHSIALEGKSIPTDARVIAASELLGIDPIHVACEGMMAIAIPHDQSALAIEVLRKIPVAASSAIIGSVVEKTAAPVMIRRGLGRYQAIDQPTGAPLPRIC